jgi:hypothetical protein
MTQTAQRATWRRRPLAAAAALALVGIATGCAPGAAGSAGGRAGNGPRLTFKERTHDFGRISTSRKQQYEFAFTNTGTAPLDLGDIRLAPGGPGG